MKASVDQSRKERELRSVIASELTEVLTEFEQLRPPRKAPAGVARFVSAAERTLAVLHERAQADERRPPVASPPALGSRDRLGQTEKHDG